jgi:hypothetical protein
VSFRPHLTGWAWYWLAWVVAGFGAPEAWWLVNNVRNTLSDQVWGLESENLAHPFDFSAWPWPHYVFAAVFLIFIVWLTGHLVLGIWR